MNIKEKKPKSEFIESKWFMRVVSLVFALMLFANVQADNKAKGIFGRQATLDLNATQTISNIPVQIGDLADDMMLSDLPKTVNVVLKGPRNIISRITADQFEVRTESLKDVDTGKQTVTLIAVGLPENVKYDITPSSKVVVTIERRKTIEADVIYEVAGDAIADQFEVGQVILSPHKVTLTGAETLIDKVDKVYIRITTNQPRSSSFTEKYKLQIVDSLGNLLNVQSSHNSIEATIEVGTTEKEVPLIVQPIGEQRDMYDYQYVLPSVLTARVQGDSGVLATLTQLYVQVDVSNLTGADTLTGHVLVPQNVTVNVKEVPIQAITKPKMISSESEHSENESESSDERESYSQEESTAEMSSSE